VTESSVCDYGLGFAATKSTARRSQQEQRVVAYFLERLRHGFRLVQAGLANRQIAPRLAGPTSGRRAQSEPPQGLLEHLYRLGAGEQTAPVDHHCRHRVDAAPLPQAHAAAHFVGIGSAGQDLECTAVIQPARRGDRVQQHVGQGRVLATRVVGLQQLALELERPALPPGPDQQPVRVEGVVDMGALGQRQAGLGAALADERLPRRQFGGTDAVLARCVVSDRLARRRDAGIQLERLQVQFDLSVVAQAGDRLRQASGTTSGARTRVMVTWRRMSASPRRSAYSRMLGCCSSR